MDNQKNFAGEGDYDRDREALRFFDVAHEGAQLRCVAQVADALERLRDMAPRSVVVIATDNIACASARAVLEVRAPLALPVLVTPVLPRFVGPLDVVVVVGAVVDLEHVGAIATAERRGAETIVVGPVDNSFEQDVPAAVLVIPVLPSILSPSPARAFGALAAVLEALAEPAIHVSNYLEGLANEVDQELVALNPQRDATVNPARQLRAFVADSRVVHSGVGRCGHAVAQLVAQLWSVHGIPSGCVGERELLTAAGAQYAAADIFFDPFIDGPEQPRPIKTVLWAKEETTMLHSRAESVTHRGDTVELGVEAATLRLITRAYAVTAMDSKQ